MRRNAPLCRTCAVAFDLPYLCRAFQNTLPKMHSICRMCRTRCVDPVPHSGPVALLELVDRTRQSRADPSPLSSPRPGTCGDQARMTQQGTDTPRPHCSPVVRLTWSRIGSGVGHGDRGRCRPAYPQFERIERIERRPWAQFERVLWCGAAQGRVGGGDRGRREWRLEPLAV